MSEITLKESRRVVRPMPFTLDSVLRLPTSARLQRGMRTVCDVCRQPITDTYFYGGFITGHRNVLLHEVCTPVAMRTAPVGSTPT